ncbi:hypothetical protein K432DRAFT_448388 [Lepidopterella palustris CBS 459.81]|uniref:F-box domain-containing protein n=1 Tax=Lepidopterella palustris CBS 459.81 TaxID=1314670 RepID=A0A8E2JKW1_9PEZI|nr:hypothetical protein K432DRAFT_448388 [Lepidopterella palustris CBS 459.81]
MACVYSTGGSGDSFDLFSKSLGEEFYLDSRPRTLWSTSLRHAVGLPGQRREISAFVRYPRTNSSMNLAYRQIFFQSKDMVDPIPSAFPLLRLPDDILIIVFEKLYLCSPYTLKSCTGVCHHFYKLGIPILSRKALVFNSKVHAQTQRLIKKGSRLPTFTRTATLDDRVQFGSDEAKPLLDFISKAPNLKTVRWNGGYNISAKLLKYLETHHPTVKLVVDARIPRKEDKYYQGWGLSLDGLIGFSSPQLYSLTTDIRLSLYERGIVEKCLAKIIKTCPNLQVLKSFPYVPYFDTTWHIDMDLDLQPTDLLPTLERFCYVPLTHKTLTTWGNAGGWQRLMVLKVHKFDYLRAFHGRAPCLKYLVVWSAGEDFNNLPPFEAPLQQLILVGQKSSRVPLEFLRQYSSTLLKLRIHSARLVEGQLKDASATDILELNRSCPNITRLDINMHHGGTWPYDFLDALAQFGNLIQITLYAETPIQTPSMTAISIVEPLITAAACEGLFKYVADRKLGARLSVLGLERCAASSEAFHSYAERDPTPTYNCFLAKDGSVSVQSPPKRQPGDDDVALFHRIQTESLAKELLNRPFKALYPMSRGLEDVIWVAKQLGPGPKWAERELVATRLMTKEQFDAEQTPFMPDFFDSVTWEKRMEHRRIVKEELAWWKRRKELEERHGKYYSLFDSLYPER